MENKDDYKANENEDAEWEVNKIYDNLDYKNDWLDQKQDNIICNDKNILYEKLKLDYVSFFDGPKNFHKEQSRRKFK